MQLAGRVAVVTGAAGGIGKSVDVRDVAGMGLHPLGGVRDHCQSVVVHRRRPFLEEHDELLLWRIGRTGGAGHRT